MTPVADLPFVLSEGMRIWLAPPPRVGGQLVVESVRSGPKGPLVKISSIDDVDTAALARGSSILIAAADMPQFAAEELFDPVGVSVSTRDGVLLGEIVEVLVTGANDVWVVRGDAYGEVLLPVIDDVVLEIDEDARTALVHVLPGLIDGYGEA